MPTFYPPTPSLNLRKPHPHNRPLRPSLTTVPRIVPRTAHYQPPHPTTRRTQTRMKRGSALANGHPRPDFLIRRLRVRVPRGPQTQGKGGSWSVLTPTVTPTRIENVSDRASEGQPHAGKDTFTSGVASGPSTPNPRHGCGGAHPKMIPAFAV